MNSITPEMKTARFRKAIVPKYVYPEYFDENCGGCNNQRIGDDYQRYCKMFDGGIFNESGGAPVDDDCICKHFNDKDGEDYWTPQPQQFVHPVRRNGVVLTGVGVWKGWGKNAPV